MSQNTIQNRFLIKIINPRKSRVIFFGNFFLKFFHFFFFFFKKNFLINKKIINKKKIIYKLNGKSECKN